MIGYHRPPDLATALAVRAQYAATGQPLTVLAGGTDVYPAKATRAGWGHTRHPDALDISGIASLNGITETAPGWHIGALATWTDIIRAPLPAAFDGLRQAAREVGGAQIQNRGTLVGNICTASPAADGVPCLLTLDARVHIASADGTREVTLADFITGPRRTALCPDEIVTGIAIPLQAGTGRFLKLGARRYLVISIAMVAGVIDLDTEVRVRSARIAIGACSAVAVRQPLLEGFLVGRDLTALPADVIAPELITGLGPIDDIRAGAEFRHHASLELTRDLLAAAAHVPIRRVA